MPAEGLTGMLRSFRLPTMAAVWEECVAQALTGLHSMQQCYCC